MPVWPASVSPVMSKVRPSIPSKVSPFPIHHTPGTCELLQFVSTRGGSIVIWLPLTPVIFLRIACERLLYSPAAHPTFPPSPYWSPFGHDLPITPASVMVAPYTSEINTPPVSLVARPPPLA